MPLLRRPGLSNRSTGTQRTMCFFTYKLRGFEDGNASAYLGGDSSGGGAALSPTLTPASASAAPRSAGGRAGQPGFFDHPIEGLRNFRDIGLFSSSIRPGVAYRSDHPRDMTGTGAATLTRTCHTVINLCSREETWAGDDTPYDQMLAAHGIRAIDAGIKSAGHAFTLYTEGPEGKRKAYSAMLGDAAVVACFRQALLLFAEEPEALPAVFHCHSGLDRTGLLSMLCLLAVGASRSEIVADYAASSTTRFNGTARQQLDDHLIKAKDDRLAQLGVTKGTFLFGSSAQTMEGMLTWLDEQHGSAEHVLTSARGVGLTAGQLAALRVALSPSSSDAKL